MRVAHDGSPHSLNPFEQNLDAFLGPAPAALAPAATPATRARATVPSAVRSLVVVGNLPVLSGLWLSQFADREARERGAVCLLRVDRDSVQLELFVAHGARPAIRPQATLAEALRAIAPVAAEWLVVPPGLDSLEIPGETGEVVILTGADDAAVVAAYGLVKRCVESLDRRESGRILRRTAPRISVTVLGASDDDVAAVRDKLDKTTRALLKVDLPVRGGLQRVAPTESAFRGTFDAHAPIVADLFAMIRTAEAAASLDAGATSTEDEAPPIAARAERFSARPERVAPRRNSFEPSAFRTGSIPFTRSGVLPPLAASAPTEALTAPSARAGRVASTEPVRAFVAPTSAVSTAFPVAPASLPSAVKPVVSVPNGAYHAASIPTPTSARKEALRPPSTQPASTSAALPPEIIAPTRARAVSHALPDALVPELVGLEPIAIRAPRDSGVELAIDADGRLHIVGRATDATAILRVRGWARDHGELLSMADPRIARAEPIIDLVVSDLRDARAIDGATVHVLTLVEIAGRRGYLAQIAPRD